MTDLALSHDEISVRFTPTEKVLGILRDVTGAAYDELLVSTPDAERLVVELG